MKKAIASVLFILVLLSTTSAQLTTLKEAKEPIKGYYHELFKPKPGIYASIDWGREEFVIFDENLTLKTTAETKWLKKKQYLGGLEKNGAVYIFFQEKNQVFSAEMDLTSGQLKSEPSPIFTVDTKYTTWFYRGHSADSAYSYIVCSYTVSKGNHQMFDGIIFDKNMKIIKKFSVKLEDLGETFQSIHMHQNTEGTLFVTSSVRLKKARKTNRPFAWLITEIDKNGQSATTFLDELSEDRVENMCWKLTKEGISFVGLQSSGDKEGYKHIVSGDFNSWSKKLINFKKTDLTNSPFWNSVTDKKLLELKEIGIPISRIIQTFTSTDGTTYLVIQWFSTYTRTRTGSTPGSSSYTISDSYANEIYVLSIAPDQSLNWVKQILVYQQEPTLQLYTGSIAIFHPEKGIYVFYNNSDKNQNTSRDSKLYGNTSSTNWLSPQQYRVAISGNWKNKCNTYVTNIKTDGTETSSIAGIYSDIDFHLGISRFNKQYGNELFFISSKKSRKGFVKPSLFVIN